MSHRGVGDGSLPPLPRHLDPRRPRRHTSLGLAVKRLVLSVMAVVSVVTLVGAGYAWWKFRDANSGLQRVNFNPRAAQKKPDFDGKDQNLLVVGYDSRAGLTPAEIKQLHVGTDVSSSTDSMMIIHVPANGSKATLISLPRDAYVSIPGHGMNKLNAAFADGSLSLPSTATDNQRKAAGAQLLTETISNLTGLTIDHFVLVSFGGFVAISDAIGGVEVNLCNAVDDSAAANAAAGLQGGSGLVLSAGKHNIHGAQALQFVRQRHFLPNGDLDRTARQRYFLTQAFRAVASAGTLLNPGRLSSLVTAVDRSIWVDKSFDLQHLALQMSSLDPGHIISKAIPFEHFATVDVGSVEIVDVAKVQAFVKNLISPPAKPSTSTAKPSTTHPATSTPHPSTSSRKPSSTCIN